MKSYLRRGIAMTNDCALNFIKANGVPRDAGAVRCNPFRTTSSNVLAGTVEMSEEFERLLTRQPRV
jgi:hypothetical protein